MWAVNAGGSGSPYRTRGGGSGEVLRGRGRDSGSGGGTGPGRGRDRGRDGTGEGGTGQGHRDRGRGGDKTGGGTGGGGQAEGQDGGGTEGKSLQKVRRTGQFWQQTGTTWYDACLAAEYNVENAEGLAKLKQQLRLGYATTKCASPWSPKPKSDVTWAWTAWFKALAKCRIGVPVSTWFYGFLVHMPDSDFRSRSLYCSPPPGYEQMSEDLSTLEPFGTTWNDLMTAFVLVKSRSFGAGTGWLIRIGPVSGQFQTGFRPVSDQCHVGCTVHVTVS